MNTLTILILLQIFKMNEFKTIDDYCLFIDKDNNKSFQKLNDISSNIFVYMYSLKENQVVYFNYDEGCGWVKSYEEARIDFEQESINLRNILAKEIGGIEYSRTNYLNRKGDIVSSFETNPNQYIDILNKLCENRMTLDEMLKDSGLVYLNEKLNGLKDVEIMEYEISILFLFVHYIVKKYNNKITTISKENPFREKYIGIKVENQRGNIYDLSEIVFRVLYPDYNRDYFENEEDVKINLQIVKEYADYNS